MAGSGVRLRGVRGDLLELPAERGKFLLSGKRDVLNKHHLVPGEAGAVQRVGKGSDLGPAVVLDGAEDYILHKDSFYKDSFRRIAPMPRKAPWTDWYCWTNSKNSKSCASSFFSICQSSAVPGQESEHTS